MNLADECKMPAAKSRTGTKKPAAEKTAARVASAWKVAVPARKVAARKTYGVVAEEKGRTVSAASLLGVERGERKQSLTAMEWISLIRQGIPSTAVDALTGFLHVSQSELSDALGIPERTLARRKGEGVLNSEESAKMVRIARVFARAEEVFEGPDAARDWLKSANTSLSGETPISLLDTEIGAESVMDTLGRIEHGVFG